MPSPFPGMDPYLEDPAHWPDRHHDLIGAIKGELTRSLRPKYVARCEKRVYVSSENDPGRTVMVPDVRIVAKSDWGPLSARRAYDEGAVGVAEPVDCTTMLDEEIREPRVEIVDLEHRRVVTVIEVLRPTNKVPGASGTGSFRTKRHQVIRSDSHWVEIDLLREGERLVYGELLPFEADYMVHVSRAQRRPGGRVWQIYVAQRLPVIPIPLRPEDPDYPLDLQALLSDIYDAGAYDLDVDYRKDPVPPLKPEQAAWADGLLRAKGLRS